MYITYKIIRFSPNFVGIRMFTSEMTSKLPNDLKCELLMAVFRYLFVIQGCPHSIIIFWEKDRNRRDSAFSTKLTAKRTQHNSRISLYHWHKNSQYVASSGQTLKVQQLYLQTWLRGTVYLDRV